MNVYNAHTWALCLLAAGHLSIGALSCDKKDAIRYAVVNARVYAKMEGKELSKAYVRRGEKLYLLEAGAKRSRVRLSDGQEGYLLNRWLAYKIVVIPESAGYKVYSRPTVTSQPKSNSAFLRPAVPFFVIESRENDEGEWYRVTARFWTVSGIFKGLRGWLKRDKGLIEDLAVVQDSLALNRAIAKVSPRAKRKDFSELEQLLNKAGPVGQAAVMVDEELRVSPTEAPENSEPGAEQPGTTL